MSAYIQISNKVYCQAFLNDLDIKTKLLTNPYYDYPFLYIENFMSKNNCHKIINNIAVQDNIKKAKIRTKDLKENLDQNIRKTNLYQLQKTDLKSYNTTFSHLKNSIEKYFNIILTTASEPQILQYNKGCFYVAHSDDSNMVIDKNNNIIAFEPVATNRKLTTVVFLSQYESEDMQYGYLGGELLFNYLVDEKKEPISLKPNMGDMIVFLSNPYFTHEVLEVQDGNRVTLVQWHDANNI